MTRTFNCLYFESALITGTSYVIRLSFYVTAYDEIISRAREEFCRGGRSLGFMISGEELFISGGDEMRRERLFFSLVFYRQMAQTLITVTNPTRSPSRSHVSANAKEFIASNKKAHRSLSRDIVELRLCGCDMSAMVLGTYRFPARAKEKLKNKKIKKYQRSMCRTPRAACNNVLHARRHF